MSDLRRERTKGKVNRNTAEATDVAPPYLRSYAEWKGYVNVSVSEAEKGRFYAFVNDSSLVREVTAEVLSRGYKLSAVQSDPDGTVKASAFAGFVLLPDAGLSVSAWGADYYIALASVVYLVALVAQFDLSKFYNERPAARGHTF